jgi:hypothetical protein
LLIKLFLGLILAFLTLPLLFVNGDWKKRPAANAEEILAPESSPTLNGVNSEPENLRNQSSSRPESLTGLTGSIKSIGSTPDTRKITEFKKAIKTRAWWSGAVAFGLIQPPFIFLIVNYAYYLKTYKMNERATSVNTSFVMLIGIIGGILVNLSSKFFFMTKLLYFLIASGMMLISLPSILVRQKLIVDSHHGADFESLMLFIGETLFGIGVIGKFFFLKRTGNLSFVTMALCSMFPKIDYNILLCVPQTVGTGLAVLFCFLVISVGDWG